MNQPPPKNIDALYAAGREAWPTIELSCETFAAFVAGRGEEHIDPARGPDLYLTSACLQGNAIATQTFEEQFSPEFERAAQRLRNTTSSPEDVRQLLLDRLLVAKENQPAKLASYSGRGSLVNWVRAVAARAIIDIHRKGPSQEVSGHDGLFDKLTDSSDPEIQYLKKHYRQEFKVAFESAIAALAARERNTLRHLFLENLTIDEMGALYNIHRSTAARRMTYAREALLEATREELVRRLKVNDNELDSIMRVIDSQFDLSLDRLLAHSRST